MNCNLLSVVCLNVNALYCVLYHFLLQVLAMCFVRKLLDYVFTRHELRWLDDILPESHKKEKEDKKKKEKEKQGVQVCIERYRCV